MNKYYYKTNKSKFNNPKKISKFVKILNLKI